MSKADAAKAYRERGWRVIPLHGLNSVSCEGCTCRKGKDCRSAAKHPVADAWQKAEPLTAEQIDEAWSGWRESSNVGIATGSASGFFVLDVDPDNGGADSLKRLQNDYAPLDVACATETGSGGWHLLMKMPEDFEPTNRRGGLKDYVGLDIRGTGGQIVAPPSVTPKGAYRWLKEGEPGPAPEWLLDLLRPAPVQAATPAAPLVPADDAEARRLQVYAEAVRVGEIARLTAMAAAAVPEGQTYSGEPWDATTHAVACNLLELANSDWAPYDAATAYADLHQHAPRDAGFTDLDVNRKWQSAIATAGDKARAFPVARESTDDMVKSWAAEPGVKVDPIRLQPQSPAQPADEGAARSRGLTAADVIAFVEARYDVAMTPAQEVFATPNQGPRLVAMLSERGGSLRDQVTAAIFDSAGQVPGSKAVDDAFRVIVARARTSGKVVPLHLRVAPFAEGYVIDLGQQGNANCAVMTVDGVTRQDNPPRGVEFRRTNATRPLPNPADVGSLEPLRELLGLKPGRTWDLMRGWVVAGAVPTAARPCLAFHGPAGGGKSTWARTTLSVLDPRAELGSSFGKNLGDDQVKALGRFWVGYDNLTAVSDAVSDHICRLVSGDEIDKRKLYSDTEQVVMSYRRTGAMTAVSLPPLRADALERIIPIALDRVAEGSRRSESRISAAFEEAHPVILRGLCDALVTVLRRLPAVQAERVPRPRMADYFDIVRAYDPAAAEVYRESTATVMVDAAEADPFVATVAAWLREAGLPWEGTAAQAHQAASAYRAEMWSTGWWPTSASAFSAALARTSEPLRAVGLAAGQRRSNGRKLLVLTAIGDAALTCATGSAAA